MNEIVIENVRRRGNEWKFLVSLAQLWHLFEMLPGFVERQILICQCFIFCVCCNKPIAPEVDSWHLLLVCKKFYFSVSDTVQVYNISQVCLVILVIFSTLLPCLIPTAHSHLVHHFSHEFWSYV